LLGRCIAGGAHDTAALAIGEARDTKIDHGDGAVTVVHDIGWFDIAEDDGVGLAVEVVQDIAYLIGDGQDGGFVEHTALAQDVFEVGAAHIIHNDVDSTVVDE